MDGDSHSERAEYDARRTVRLVRLVRDGMHVICFLNVDVFSHLDAVLDEILGECERLANSKLPSPDRAGTK